VGGDVGHAEEIETSHMMHRHPELVKLERAIDKTPSGKKLYSVDPSYNGHTLCALLSPHFNS